VCHILRCCGDMVNHLLATFIFVRNSSNASNIASVAFASAFGTGMQIDAQNTCWRSGDQRLAATKALDADGWQKKVCPLPKEISSLLGLYSASSLIKLSRCFPNSLLPSVSIS